MSGFEIAGIVLGAIPVAIEIYDLYRKKSESVFKYAEVMRKFVRTLHTARSRLRNCLEKLLHGQVDDDVYNALLSDRNTTKWSDPGVEAKLRDLLQHSFFGYIETLNAIHESLGKLEKLVCYDERKSKSWIEHLAFPKTKIRFHKSVWKRITACIDHNKHIELLQSLDKDIDQLENLTTTTLELDPIRQDQKKKMKNRQIEIVRKLVTSLHSSLSTRWPCQCQEPHFAHLQLENLSQVEENALRFRILFTYGFPQANLSSLSKKMKEYEVEPRTKILPAKPTTISFANTNPVQLQTPSATALDDLCSQIALSHATGCCIGFVDDADATHYIHEVVPSPYTAGAVEPPFSLRNLLSGTPNTSPANVDLSAGGRHKYELAVTLATSVLQLNKTPWLKDRWSSEDVLFLPPTGEASPARCAYISRPFAPASLPRTNTISLPNRPTVRNEALFALGVALIELSLGKPLEFFIEPGDLDANGERTMITEYIVAKRLMTKVAQKEGNRYTDAVNRCLHGLFDGLEPDLTNEKFRQGFYQSVVVELRDLLHDFIR